MATATKGHGSAETGLYLLASAPTAMSRRVYDIVSFLPQGDLEALRNHWVKGGTAGVTKELFLENMLRVRIFELHCCDLRRRSSGTCFGLVHFRLRHVPMKHSVICLLLCCRAEGRQVLTPAFVASQGNRLLR